MKSKTIRKVLAAYFRILIDTLKGVEPEKINSAYISTIIDRIF